MGSALTRTLILGIRFSLVAGIGALACACVSLPENAPLTPPPIAASPVARQVQEASNSKAAFPKFSQIPKIPTDIRPLRAWNRSVYDMLRARRQMLVQADMLPPPVSDTAEWAAQERGNLKTPSAASARSEGFTQSGRERATPPSSAR